MSLDELVAEWREDLNKMPIQENKKLEEISRGVKYVCLAGTAYTLWRMGLPFIQGENISSLPTALQFFSKASLAIATSGLALHYSAWEKLENADIRRKNGENLSPLAYAEIDKELKRGLYGHHVGGIGLCLAASSWSLLAPIMLPVVAYFMYIISFKHYTAMYTAKREVLHQPSGFHAKETTAV